MTIGGKCVTLAGLVFNGAPLRHAWRHPRHTVKTHSFQHCNRSGDFGSRSVIIVVTNLGSWKRTDKRTDHFRVHSADQVANLTLNSTRA